MSAVLQQTGILVILQLLVETINSNIYYVYIDFFEYNYNPYRPFITSAFTSSSDISSPLRKS